MTGYGLYLYSDHGMNVTGIRSSGNSYGAFLFSMNDSMITGFNVSDPSDSSGKGITVSGYNNTFSGLEISDMPTEGFTLTNDSPTRLGQTTTTVRVGIDAIFTF